MPLPAWNSFFNLEMDLDDKYTLSASTWSLLPVPFKVHNLGYSHNFSYNAMIWTHKNSDYMHEFFAIAPLSRNRCVYLPEAWERRSGASTGMHLAM